MKILNYPIKIIKTYKFYIIKILIFEIFFLVRMFRGGKIKINNHKYYTDNIPCPYLFLWKIKNFLIGKNIKSLIDLGCGSGRVIFFLNKYINLNLVGIEYDQQTSESCRKIFEKKQNIEIINDDIMSFKFLNKEFDCYFMNDPLKDDDHFNKLIAKIIQNNKNIDKKVYFILININKDKLKLFEQMKLIEEYKIHSNGYYIFLI